MIFINVFINLSKKFMNFRLKIIIINYMKMIVKLESIRNIYRIIKWSIKLFFFFLVI